MPDLRSLFNPRGIIVSGVSNHPGKFGFVTLHNILSCGFQGPVFALGREAGEVLNVPVLASIDDVPDGAADFLFICTPPALNEDLLRRAAAKGVTAAFCAAGGYREAGPDGAEAEARLVALCADLGIALAGPNGQGVVSTPANMCAQIVAPYAPPGRIAIASQSGNFVSSFLNMANHTGVGVSRAVAAGNASVLGIADYLEYFSDDDETAVSLVYLESVDDGRELFERIRPLSERKPIVVVKGGASAAGARAAASHTGALATDDAVFDGMCRQAGLIRARDVEEAFEAAATFATQPLPKGDRVVVVTTVGGWGVAAVDAIADTRLTTAALPDDLFAAINEKLPPRWSKNNPIDMAGGETRDTVPEILELVAGHDEVDAVVLLGLGIQSRTAAMLRSGGFFPDHGLERIVAFHERQDTRYAEAAAEISASTGTPVVAATELANTDPNNPAPATLRAMGRLCHASAGRAVRSLHHLASYAAWRRHRGL
jgi:acyl-CoA synthetase (NDP forming)